MVQETPVVTKFLREHPDDSWTVDAALANGAYGTLDAAFAMTPEELITLVQESGLRGKGGAGFGTGQKWSFLPKDVYPRYLAINGDEGEPCTFKDHMLVERDPHQVIEGVILTAYAIQAHHAFIYLRGEFALGAERLGQALADAYARGFVGENIKGSGFDLEIILHRGAGCYIAGDETGLLSSLEGERAMPRIKPPFPAVQGVYAAPTIVNNIETVSTVPHILRNGAEWYAAMGVNRSKGTRLFSVSGQVEKPGNYEIELGITFRDLIEGLAGGVKGGKKLGFFIPGGASSPWLLEEHLDVALDMDYVQTELTGATTMLGSGAVMVFDEDVDPLLIAWRIAKFFSHESCGKCTPCREGTGWVEKVLYRMAHGHGRPDDLDLLLSFGNNLAPGLNWPPGMYTICQLGPSAMSPAVSLNRWWRDEIIERMTRDTERRAVLPKSGPRYERAGSMTVDRIPMSQWPSEHGYVIPVAPGPDVVTLTIDGKEVQAPRGELLIKVAQEHGTYIPRFCWHERMKPVGMCRMCLVEVEGMRGLQISCATPVADGMVVNTHKPNVKSAQDGVLELLLINHPLDCPVCDRGGECPLQDQTLAFGPGESRFVEEKRHFEKPIPISDLVLLDRERCIQCGRCTRFAAEVAGDPLIDFGGRGGTTEVITYPDEPFSSYFSGNTVQICPVGALTASAYRFRARPWDLETVETSCQTCAVGCRGALQSTSNRIVRLLGVDSEPVNQGWLCDKGRYGYEWVHRADRVRAPMVRKAGELVEVSWPEALDAAAAGLQRASAVAVIGGARGTNEDAYAWARFAKGVLGTDNVDAQLADGLPAEVVLGLPPATIADVDHARAIVLVGPDLKDELPVLYLRVRRAAADLGVPVIEISPRASGLTRYASAVLRHAPGEAGSIARQFARAVAGDGTASGDGQIERATGALDGREGDIVVILGRQSVAESADAVVQAAAALAALPGAKFLSALRRGNVRGALDLGLTPGFLPGRVTLDVARDHFTAAWGRVPEARGLDTAGALAAAADGTIDTLVLLGVDPIADFPDRAVVVAALDAVKFVVAVGAFTADAAERADVFLPVSVWGEKAGSTTNLEGRVLRLARLVSPDGITMPDWRIAAELALRFGVDFGFETVEDVQDEIARVAPAHAGVDAALVRRARDGAVLPISEFPDEIVLHASQGFTAGVSWEPIPPAPVEEADDDTVPTADPPLPLYSWDRVAPETQSVPIDAYSLRLVAARTLYDAGRTAASGTSLAALAPGAALVVHPSDLSRIGVAAEGDEVRVTSPRGTVTIAVRTDAATAPGTAFMAVAQPGAVGPNDLVTVTDAVTDLRVETTRSGSGT